MAQSNEPTIELRSSLYRTIHNWVIRHYGKASKCENSECSHKSKKFEWALKKGFPYDKCRDNFMQLCVSCHRKYDYSEKSRFAIKIVFAAGRQFRKRPVIKLYSTGEEAAKYESIAQAAKDMGCTHPSIIDAIKSNTYVKGFKWRYA